MKKVIILLSTAFIVFGCKVNNFTTFTNPIINADVPDLSATRCGDYFYLISTTMHLMPGAPVMKSKDLVHWDMASYVFDCLTDNLKYDLLNGSVYGRGQWASSLRYNKGKFYVLFSPNDEPYKAYIYSTTNPRSGKWDLISRTQHFHDASLFFDDDDRVYVFSGTGSLIELKSDLSDVKPDGVNMHIFERDAEETGLLEGSQVVKYNGKYYLLMVSWPENGKRRQVCFRANKITGPYEKKVILEDNFEGFPYAGQGCLVDDKNGNWYGLVFQDRGGIGRVPLLLPCHWIDGWPILGDNGRVPLTGKVALKSYDTGNRIVESDNFNINGLNINWQWNHNPQNKYWSLKERPGYLRLKTSRVVDDLYKAPNTLTQRMEGPKCSGVVAFDVSQMKDGDVSGFAAFNGNSGLLSIIMDGNKKYLTMSTNVVDLDSKKKIRGVQVEEKARIDLTQNIIYLRIDCDFNLNKDLATFYYSIDSKDWKPIGTSFKMVFDYLKLFMGTRFAIFNYATKAIGGYIDVDYFKYDRPNNDSLKDS